MTVHLALKDTDVTMVSAMEDIGETPSGMLLHGIVSSIAVFYHRNLATEVVKVLSQKALQGGTETIEAVSEMIHSRFDEMMAEGSADLASRRTQL